MSRLLQKTFAYNEVSRMFISYFLLPLVLITVFTEECKSQIHVNAIATGTNDGTSWTNAYNSLQEA